MNEHDQTTMDRRRFLKLGGRGLATLGTGAAMAPLLGAAKCDTGGRAPDVRAIGEISLKKRAEAKGLLFGTALRPRHLFREAYKKAVISDCNIIVPEIHLKWDRLHDREVDPDFGPADGLLEFADQHGMAFRGHALLWYKRTPTWVRRALDEKKRDPVDILTKHVREVAGHYAGKMHSWDVVNEAIEPKDGRLDGLRNTPFLKAIGPEYIAETFKAAAGADPNALLVLNDYGLESGWYRGRLRRWRTLSLLERLLKAGAPVHVCGLQGHLKPDREGSLDRSALRSFCREVSDMGLKIMITELDARDTKISGSIEERDRIVAEAYYRFLEVVLEFPATIGILTWGLSDDLSWLNKSSPRKDGTLVRGTPYDKDVRRKPAWYAVASAIDNAAPRPGSSG